jgi:formylglycine-generating enzyme required for sulfatase activity
MLQFLPVLALTAAGCLAKDSGRPVGEQCSADGDCRSGLHCQYGRCRQACTYDRDCEAGAVCVPSVGDPSIYVCTLPDEGGGAACPGGLTVDGIGACRRPCNPQGPQPEAVCGPAQTCDQGWCRPVEGLDAGVPGPGDGGGDGGDSRDSPDTDVDARGDGDVASDGALDDGGASGVVGEPTAPGPWVLINANGATFTMGSPVGELGRDTGEVEHEVTLTESYWMMTTEVTQQQFLAVMRYNPSRFSAGGAGPDCGGECPVEQVSWHEAAAYANALSVLEGLQECYRCSGVAPDFRCVPQSSYVSPSLCHGYRLPTEAEWEYAARAGTTTATYNGDLLAIDCDPNPVLEPIAWWCGNTNDPRMTLPVKGKRANPWGLHDLFGNVYEWCHDWHAPYSGGPETDPSGPVTGTERVVRGGTYHYGAQECRAAYRFFQAPDTGYNNNGARMVRTLEP